jgi:hypothetical protein
MFEFAKRQLDPAAVPEAWSGVQEFAHWWCDAGMPLLPPTGAEVFLSDDATAFCMFRRGRFQVEMYLIHPQPNLQDHEHPGVEVIKMRIEGTVSPNTGPFQVPGTWGRMSPVLKRGRAHGNGAASFGEVLGFPLVAFQHWQDREPCTVAAAWKGPTVGPKHEALIRRFYPDAFIERGYADITKPTNYRELLAQGKA